MIETRAQCEAWDTEANDKLGNKLLTNAQRSLYRSLYAIDGDDSQDPEEENTAVTGTPTPSTDRFFGKNEEDTESVRKSEECRAAILSFLKEDPSNPPEAVQIFSSRYGQVEQWRPGTCLQCYKELRDAGYKLKEVAL
jgi:hypothetical protein